MIYYMQSKQRKHTIVLRCLNPTFAPSPPFHSGLLVEGWPVHCRVFSSTPDLYPLDANIIPALGCDTRQRLYVSPHVPVRSNAQVQNQWSKWQHYRKLSLCFVAFKIVEYVHMYKSDNNKNAVILKIYSPSRREILKSVKKKTTSIRKGLQNRCIVIFL